MAYVNVVIPVYNAKEYLVDAVNSVLDQPEKDINIVLVNDGSTDGSRELCDTIAEKNKRISVIHQKNKGVSSARNAGIEFFLKHISEGYIAFLDADDLWISNGLSIAIINEMKEADADIVGFSAYCSNQDVTRFKIANQYEKKLVEYEKYKTEHLYRTGSFAIRFYNIRLFNENPIRFVVGCAHNEDEIFLSKMLFCSKSYYQRNEYLYVYRKNYLSSTSVNKYTLKSAVYIPDAWKEAGAFSTSCFNISEQDRKRWKFFCEKVSSIRCLEMLRILSELGYKQKDIESVFCNKDYYLNIEYLEMAELANWQQTDLVQYKLNREDFYRKMRIKKYMRELKKRLRSCNIFRMIYDKKIYKISFDEVYKKCGKEFGDV